MRRRARLSLDCLESREVPANLTTSFSTTTHTLTITGDADANNLTVVAISGDATRFGLTSAADTFNGTTNKTLETATGVKNIVIQMLGGNDSVTFGNTNGAIDLQGNLTVNGGDGANSFTSADLKVEGSLSITNGTNTILQDSASLTNLNVGGSVTINNGNGDTTTSIIRNTAGNSTIHGSLSVTNGTGEDHTIITDMNINGNATVNNGAGSAAGVAGYVRFANQSNSTARSAIGGNLTVSYVSGNITTYDSLYDTIVHGNASFNYGTGNYVANFDGFSTTLPAEIDGSLTMTGTGQASVIVGDSGKDTGLIVGKSLAITTGAGNDALTLDQLEVDGAASFKLGAGNNTLTATSLAVKSALSVANGVHTGTATTTLTDVVIGGAATITNSGGDTHTEIGRDTAGNSYIRGNLSITNGTGQDETSIYDTNIGGNVTVSDGAGNAAGSAGYTNIYNETNTAARSVIGGNLVVSYAGGNVLLNDVVSDTVVEGNVSFSYGSGDYAIDFDGYKTTLPVAIRGSLTMTGTGKATIAVGTLKHIGLIVGKTLAVTTGAKDDMLTLDKLEADGAASFNLGAGTNNLSATGLTVKGALSVIGGTNTDTVNINGAEVDGATVLNLGNGDNNVSIDDAVFAGTFSLTTGTGTDNISLETKTGTTVATTFERAVLIQTGAGTDTVTREGNTDAGQSIIFDSTFVIKGAENSTGVVAKESSPFGYSIQSM